jgi:hypothetical protein
VLLALGLRRWGGEPGDVVVDESAPLGLVERRPQDRVDLPDRCRSKTSLAQPRMHTVDVQRRQLRQLDLAERRLDVALDDESAVVQRRVGTAELGDVIEPAVEQLRERAVLGGDPTRRNCRLKLSERELQLALGRGVDRADHAVVTTRRRISTDGHDELPRAGVRSRIVPIAPPRFAPIPTIETSKSMPLSWDDVGAPPGSRTLNQRIKSPLLYR